MELIKTLYVEDYVRSNRYRSINFSFFSFRFILIWLQFLLVTIIINYLYICLFIHLIIFNFLQIFTIKENKALEKYLLRCSFMYYGLTYTKVRKLAFDYANRLKSPSRKWPKNEIAGIDWLYGFMQLHPNLTLRRPQSMSIGRANAINKQNVTLFLKNFEGRARSFSNFSWKDLENGWNCYENCSTSVRSRCSSRC